MKEFHGRATVQIDTAPEEVFGVITDVDRLPEWNRAIEAVVERPPALVEGAEWRVKMHPPRLPSWGSISRVATLDRDNLRFAYETRNADGNPSWTDWAWEVQGTDAGAEVTVTWDCHLETPDRKFLAGPMRKRHLAREVPTSLMALTETLARPSMP